MTTGEPTSPTVQPSPGDIPLRGPGALATVPDERWVHSFLISLLPVIGIVIARLISEGFTWRMFSPVDIGVAMLSAAAVLLVQTITSTKVRALSEILPTVFAIIIFAIAFVLVTALDTLNTDTTDTHLTVAATQVLTQLNAFQSTHDTSSVTLGPSILTDRAALQTAVTTAEGRARPHRPLVFVGVVSILFLVFAIKTWSRL